MGNHFDPYEEERADIEAQRTATGVAMKTKIIHTEPRHLVQEYSSIIGRMTAIEAHILGGQHVDNIRRVRKELADLFGVSP